MQPHLLAALPIDVLLWGVLVHLDVDDWMSLALVDEAWFDSVVLPAVTAHGFSVTASRILTKDERTWFRARAIPIALLDETREEVIDGRRRTIWMRNGKLHRDGDRPAVRWANGHREWYQHGKRHRDGDRPAEIDPGGCGMCAVRKWYQRDKLHRDGDRPAVIYINSGGVHCQQWFQNGVPHRGGDMPAEIYFHQGSIITQSWYWEGELHRAFDRPATISGHGLRCWYRHGKLHRDDNKPAVIYPGVYEEWWVHGRRRGEPRGFGIVEFWSGW